METKTLEVMICSGNRSEVVDVPVNEIAYMMTKIGLIKRGESMSNVPVKVNHSINGEDFTSYSVDSGCKFPIPESWVEFYGGDEATIHSGDPKELGYVVLVFRGLDALDNFTDEELGVQPVFGWVVKKYKTELINFQYSEVGVRFILDCLGVGLWEDVRVEHLVSNEDDNMYLFTRHMGGGYVNYVEEFFENTKRATCNASEISNGRVVVVKEQFLSEKLRRLAEIEIANK